MSPSYCAQDYLLKQPVESPKMIIKKVWIRFALKHWYTIIPSSTKVNFSCGANIQDNILIKIKIEDDFGKQ